VSTYADLIADVEGYVSSFSSQRDQVTSLLNDLNSTDLQFLVDDAAQVSRGFCEIDDEIVAVKKVDSTSGLVYAHPWGRGAKGTTATSHLSGDRVTDSPRYPRTRIKQEILQVIASLFPQLYAIATDESNTARPQLITYPLPADAQGIISVTVHSLGATQMWVPINRWKLDNLADTTQFPTGKSIDIYKGMPPGQKIKIVYRKPFGTFADETSSFDSIGLPATCRDIVKFKASAQMLMAEDSGRIQTDTIESANRAQLVQPGAATAMARQLLGYVETRITEERQRLEVLYPNLQVRRV
jgi:hypothetical protein